MTENNLNYLTKQVLHELGFATYNIEDPLYVIEYNPSVTIVSADLDVIELNKPSTFTKNKGYFYFDRIQISGDITKEELKNILSHMIKTYRKNEFFNKLMVVSETFGINGNDLSVVRRLAEYPNLYEIRFCAKGYRIE